MNRRRLLKGSVGLAALAWLPVSAFAAAATRSRDPRLVVVIMRGGLDGLSAFPPYGDPAYRQARREEALLLPGAGDGAVLPLGGFFGAHPSLRFFQNAFAAERATVVHAVATPYRERSHFDAQNVLELGLDRPFASETGWLNRALGELTRAEGVAVGSAVPLMLRGPRQVASWAPSALPDPDSDTLARVVALYGHDSTLGANLAAALEVDDMGGDSRRERRNDVIAQYMQATARFLTHPDGPRVAVLESNGWDTHANQVGQLTNRLRGLDQALRTLSRELGDAWDDTVVLGVTEFGRTVALNGTRGTDHGTASAAFIVGGAVAGGRVIADWPGLGTANRYEGRDLQPSIDMRSVFAAVLTQHLEMTVDGVRRVFPGVAFDTKLDGVIRGTG